MRGVKILSPVLFCLLNIQAIAQTLPNIQEVSVPAPASVKIDGRAEEWGNQFRAYNKKTSIFYTLANNSDHLYLIIRADHSGIIQKILQGGITFKVDNPAKDTTSSFALTYPLIPDKNISPIIKELRGTAEITTDLLASLNMRLRAASTEIRTEGSPAIPDSLISVYNPYGIRASESLSIDRSYTFELAVPLKYFSHLVNNEGVLKYSIQQNGGKLTVSYNGVNYTSFTPEIMAILQNLKPAPGNLSMLDQTTPTNFSGNYKLAK